GDDVHGRLELGAVDAVGQLDDVVEHVPGDLPGPDLLAAALFQELQRPGAPDAVAVHPAGRGEHLADAEAADRLGAPGHEHQLGPAFLGVVVGDLVVAVLVDDVAHAAGVQARG